MCLIWIEEIIYMNIMDLSIYNADISVTFILFMRPLTCKIIDFVELSSVELRSYKTVLLMSLFLVKFKLFCVFYFNRIRNRCQFLA